MSAALLPGTKPEMLFGGWPVTPEQESEKQMLFSFIEHAPKTATVNPDLRGWWTKLGWYVCANCAGRIMARGCKLPAGSVYVLKSEAEPFGVCLCCEGRIA